MNGRSPEIDAEVNSLKNRVLDLRVFYVYLGALCGVFGCVFRGDLNPLEGFGVI